MELIEVLLTVLAPTHAALGISTLALGLTALFAPKVRGSRHSMAGRIYFFVLSVTLALGMADGLLRHPHSITFFQIATPPTFLLALLGYLMVRVRPRVWLGRPWLAWHITGMGGSFIGVVTAGSFQVFPRLLPNLLILTVAYWVIPTAVGSILIGRAIARRSPIRLRD